MKGTSQRALILALIAAIAIIFKSPVCHADRLPTKQEKIACGAHANTVAPEAVANGWARPHWQNGNPRCDGTRCKGFKINGKPTPEELNECKNAALSFIACQHWEWHFSSCLSEVLGGKYYPDPVHHSKITDPKRDGSYAASLAKCAAGCMKWVEGGVEGLRSSYYKKIAKKAVDKAKGAVARVMKSKVGKKVCVEAGKAAGKLAALSLLEVLGPPMLVWTAGQYTADAILAGGDYYVASMERTFACKNAPTTDAIRRATCAKAASASAVFTTFTGGCELVITAATDSCGPSGLGGIQMVGEACKIDRGEYSSSFMLQATELMNAAVEQQIACFNTVRLSLNYNRLCVTGLSCFPRNPGS